MYDEERTAFTSLLAQLESRNKRIKDLERQLDNYFIVSQKYLKLKQVLREMKAIAENLAPMTDEYDSCYYKDRCSKCEGKEDCQDIKVEQILQKISEAENEITAR